MNTPLGIETDLKRSLLLGLLVAVLVGGGVFYWVRTSQRAAQEAYYDLEDFLDESLSTQDAYKIQPSSMEGYETFIHNNERFTIDYPISWAVETSSSLVWGSFYSPYTDEYDFFQENVNVTTEDTSYYGEVTLEEYAAAGAENIQYALPEYTLVEQGERTFGKGNYSGAYLLGDYVTPTITLQLYSLFTLVDGKAYVITYTYETLQRDYFEAIVEPMIDSFEIF